MPARHYNLARPRAQPRYVHGVADTTRGPWRDPIHRLWTVPVPAPSRITDGRVTVRLPEVRDVEALERYAPDAVENGIWLPTGGRDAPHRTWATWFVEELRLGWTPFGGRYGGGLVAGFVGEDVAAYLNFVPLEPGVVELCYGVAPESRGRGLASSSARLAADWAISAGYREVELHISVDHQESQRVASKAGFTENRRATKYVPATGANYEDVIFTRAK